MSEENSRPALILRPEMRVYILMAAPKNPSTTAATAAVRRKAQERRAADLRAAGWTVFPPEATDEDLCGRNFCALACDRQRAALGQQIPPSGTAHA